jgi:hypothetical protein
MPSTDAFALSHLGLNDFLFAPAGTEANGMTLSLISVFARRGDDPWGEAGRLAGLPKLEAIESLAGAIAGMPTGKWKLPDATAIATRLIALLPAQSWTSAHALPVSRYGAIAGRFGRIGLVLLCIACTAVLATGVLTRMDPPKLDGSDVASFAIPPR